MPMVLFIINSGPIKWTKVSYHFQKDPGPGGAAYRIKVGREESSIIAYIEEMVGRRIEEPDFEGDALKHGASTYNLVQYVLWKLEESFGPTTDQPLWVLNNIQRVRVTTRALTIIGVCSPFVEDFGNKARRG